MADKTPCALSGRPAGKPVFFLTGYFIILALFLGAGLITTWVALLTAMHESGITGLLDNIVATTGTDSPFSVKEIIIENRHFVVIPDPFAILSVFASGAFGGLIHSIRSFYFHVIAGDLEQSEIIKLILRPFSGAILALIFYLVLRAGLDQTPSGNGNNGTSIIFYTAVGALVGMFTDQTVAKLKKVAEAILTKPEEAEHSSNKRGDT